MAYSKNLGRVRGKKGGYYDINIVRDSEGIYKVNYDYQDNNQEQIPGAKNPDTLLMPVYAPIWETNQLGEPTGRLKFVLREADNLPNESDYINLMGPQGPAGEVRINIQHTSYPTKEAMETAANDPDSGFIPDPSTLYIIQKSDALSEIYAYDEDKGHFDSLDGVDLSNYYTKDKVYTKNEIDEFLYDISYYDRLALAMLDVSYETAEGSEAVGSMNMEELAEQLSEIFARQRDLFVEILDNNNDGNVDSIIINVGPNE